LGDELDALRGGIRPLIKLTGEVFHSKTDTLCFRQFCKRAVQLRLGENRPHGEGKEFFFYVLHVVSVQEP